jgi:hypothetical protein
MLVELMVVMTILLVVVGIFSQMLLATDRLRQTNHENVLAADAVRTLVERMRNEALWDVFRLYNDDPLDDPGGADTAPGHRFEVKGLTALDGSADLTVGQVFFPAAWVEIPVIPEIEEERLELPAEGAGAGALELDLQVREDLELAELGLPRDLNGDSIVDALDHSEDHILLPVRIALEWQADSGPRRFELTTMLADFRKLAE